jgi:hypothetical protein
LLNDPCLTTGKIKKRLFLTASQQTIRRCIRKLGWRKIQTKYCQIVSPINRIKRFVYESMAKKNNENFDNVIDVENDQKNVLNNYLNIFYCFKVKFHKMNDPERSCLNVRA